MLWTDVNRLADMGLTNVDEARITPTKFYDPTLQGGEDATYSGPRALAVDDFSIVLECFLFSRMSEYVGWRILLP